MSTHTDGNEQLECVMFAPGVLYLQVCLMDSNIQLNVSLSTPGRFV